jgi:ferredoxin
VSIQKTSICNRAFLQSWARGQVAPPVLSAPGAMDGERSRVALKNIAKARLSSKLSTWSADEPECASCERCAARSPSLRRLPQVLGERRCATWHRSLAMRWMAKAQVSEKDKVFKDAVRLARRAVYLRRWTKAARWWNAVADLAWARIQRSRGVGDASGFQKSTRRTTRRVHASLRKCRCDHASLGFLQLRVLTRMAVPPRREGTCM